MGSIIKLGRGATEQHIAQAFKVAKDGDTILFPENETIVIKSGLNLNLYSRSITLDLNGSTLQQGADKVVLAVWGSHTSVLSAKLGKNAAGATTVNYADAKNVSVGDYIKVFSDDRLPNDQGAATRLGQAMKVTKKEGNTLTLEGELLYANLYKTNVRAAAYDDAAFAIINGTLRGDQSHPNWAKNLLDIRSTVGATVENVVVRDGNSMGINFVDSVNGLVSQSAAINLLDNTSKGNYGYGVHSASSLNTTVNGFYAEKVRHATDNNAVGINSPHVSPSKYGADIAFTVSNVVAMGNTAHAFSWHSEARHSTVTDSLVFDSFGVLGARGTDNSMSNVSGAGNGRGIVFYEYGDGDGLRIDVSNLHLKETTDRPYWNQGNPKNNTLRDSFFEVLSDKVKISPTDWRTTITNTTVKAGLFAVNEEITGTWATDRLLGGKGNDVIDGKGGNDYIWGGDGADRLTGGSGSDRFAYLKVEEAGDTIVDFTPGKGGDVIDVSGMWYHYGWRTMDGHVRFIQSGADTLFQVDANGGGNSYVTMARLLSTKASDITSANLSADVVVSGNGKVSGGNVVTVPKDTVELPPAFEELPDRELQKGTSGNDNIRGTNGDDLLIGGAGDDVLTGFGGDDVLVGGPGADILRGSSGNNTASYADAKEGVTASLADSRQNTGDAKGDQYYQIRGLAGSDHADKLYGNDGVNTLSGGAGDDIIYGNGGMDTIDGGDGDDRLYGGDRNDVLIGGAGDDYLFGEDGYDTLTGGSGADRFYIGGPTGTYDMITDFEAGIDKLALSKSDYKVSSLSNITFVSGSRPSPEGWGPTLLFNTQSGQIWWDPDGVGSKSAVRIADLQNLPDFGLSDVLLV